jgi:ankyrin repeat protein
MRFSIPSSILLALPALAAQGIHKAAQADDLATVRSIVTARPDQIRAEDDLNRLALHLAARYGHRKVVELLVDRGANPNAANVTGFTPLHEAARLGSTKIAELLILAGARVDAKDSLGKRPIDYATKHGYAKAVHALLEKHTAK